MGTTEASRYPLRASRRGIDGLGFAIFGIPVLLVCLGLAAVFLEPFWMAGVTILSLWIAAIACILIVQKLRRAR
ncbi:hypothetical protein V8Z80_17675 [Orrella sp. JC864]|uniref:hypothetical protein n=1 Tax=Orrella sp. JC864 TaxID=3120298 RepID=UPI0012BD2377